MAHRTVEGFIAAIDVGSVRTRITIAHRRRWRSEMKITRSSTTCEQTNADCAFTSLNLLRRSKKSSTVRNA
jgi:hypothetical protein